MAQLADPEDKRPRIRSMTMEQKYNAPMDKVFAILTDPKWLEARSLALGELSASVKTK